MYDPEIRPDGASAEPTVPVSEPAPAPAQSSAPAQEAPSAYSYRCTQEGYQTDYAGPCAPAPTVIPVTAQPVAAAPAPKQAEPKARARFSTATLICCLVISIVLSGMTSAFVTASMLSASGSGTTASTGQSGGTARNNNTNNNNNNGTAADTTSKVGIQSGNTVGDVNITISDSSSNYVEAVAAKVTPSVVGVTVTYTRTITRIFGGSSTDTVSTSQGSGIIYSSDGYIITNKHVVENAITYGNNCSVQVYLPEDPQTAIDATIVGYDAAYDLAVLKIDRTGLNAITIGSSADLVLGQHVVVIGNPGGMEFMGSVSVGYLSGLSRTITVDSVDIEVIQTDAAINPGNSGGALVDSEGRLIGITNAKIADTNFEGMGFAIPVDAVVSVCKDLIANSGKPTCYIGVTINQTITADELEYYYGYPRGILVDTVVSGSPAEEAGIRRYDIITEADGVTIDSYSKLINVLQKHIIGEPMTIKVYRSGKTIELTVTPVASNG